MTKNKAKGEMHGCIVCGKLYQLYVVHDSNGKYVGSKGKIESIEENKVTIKLKDKTVELNKSNIIAL